MQAGRRDRLVALAAQAATENDPERFRALLLKLQRLLNEKDFPSQGNKKLDRRAST